MEQQVLTLQTQVQDLRAALATRKANYDESLDTIWMLLASMLVFFMHSGFSLLEAGSVRFKNTQNILGKNLIVVTVGFLCWWAVGYSFALGMPEHPNRFIGGANFFMDGFWNDKSKFRIWLFQGTFCATGGTIVSGATAERTKLKGFATYTILMTSIIYPCVVYWVWSGHGFLNYKNDQGRYESIVGPPFMDFAGSGVVHLVGGVGALFGALLVGPRTGRFSGRDEAEFDGHSIPFCVLGTFFLFFGWYGFNPGSTGQLHDVENANRAALVAVNSTIAPCISGLTVFFIRARILQPKRLDVCAFCNGILAGLVAVTAACATIKPWESAIIGFVAAFMYQGASMLLPRFQIDDVVDAFPVHAANGLWAVLAAGLFGDPAEGIGGNGAFYGGDQFGVQIFGALIIILWSAAWSFCILLPLRLIGFLRMSDHFQDKGADFMEHSPEKAYNAHAADPAGGEQRIAV